MAVRILLIDDDADDRELFSEAIDAITPDVIFHSSAGAKQALYHLENSTKLPHLIFLDINMPEMNGWECLAVLKNNESLKHIPVIMYSTSSYPEDVQKSSQLGALCFFSKPSDYEELKKNLTLIVHYLANDAIASVGSHPSVFMTY